MIIVSDLDGTLTELGKSSVSPRTLEAAAAWKRAGHHILIATGRSSSSLPVIVRKLSDVDTVICSNGGVVKDLRTGSSTALGCFTSGEAEWIVKTARSLDRTVALRVETTSRLIADHGFQRGQAGSSIVEVCEDPFARLSPQDVIVKLSFHTSEQAYASLFRDVDCAVGRDRIVTPGTAGLSNFDVGPAGVDKGKGVDFVSRLLGFSASDCVALGDMPNDFPMLAWAGQAFCLGEHARDAPAGIRMAPSAAEEGWALTVESLLQSMQGRFDQRSQRSER